MTPSLISVITAVDPARAEHLPETWESLRDQAMPDGWDWEWLVQCDDDSTEAQKAVQSQLPTDSRISFDSSRPGGPGVARNMALARTNQRSKLVKTLDADDILGEGVLTRDIAACTQRGIIWSASRVVDMNDDGTQTPHYPYDPTPGRIRANSAILAYTRENFRILVHPATLCVRWDHLFKLGGWKALPASEDTALLMHLDAQYDGWFHQEIGLYYRRWAPQMSQMDQHSDPHELDSRRKFIVDLAQTAAALAGD